MLKKVFHLPLAVAALAAPACAQAASPAKDGRDKDRADIRAHIDSIFQAFINKDAATLRATHHQNWLPSLEGSRTMIHGVDGYMNKTYLEPTSPYRMTSYKMRESDITFQ